MEERDPGLIPDESYRLPAFDEVISVDDAFLKQDTLTLKFVQKETQARVPCIRNCGLQSEYLKKENEALKAKIKYLSILMLTL